MDLLKYKTNKIAFIGLFTTVLSCRPSQSNYIKNTSNGSAQGTSYHITYLADRELDLQMKIDSVFEAVDKSMSTYRADSDISKINKGDSTVVVDQMFRDVFELSAEVNLASNGYFDPTVGALVNAWGFGPEKEIAMDSSKVDSLMEYVGFQKTTLNQDNRIKKTNPHIYLDFNAIAQGYTVDRLVLLLDQNEISDYLVEVGGEVAAKGENRLNQKQWTVGIENPQEESSRKLKVIVRLKDRALATSGNYRKFRIDAKTGNKYVHTIDPITGFTKNSNILAASVIGRACARADAYATAFMAMDLDESIKLLVQQKELEAYIIYLDKNGVIQEFMTDGFKNLIVP